MSDEDNIIREVEDDLRRERYERLWKKYGPFVIGTVVVVLVSMIGWQQYQAWQERQRAREAEAFLGAVDLLEKGEHEAAAQALAELSKKAGSGYRAVARFHEAEAHLEQGNPDQALAAYDTLTGDGSVNPKLRGLAALKSALLLADSASPEDLKKRLTPALRPGSPWRYAAQEVMAYAQYRAGRPGEARNAYQALVNEYNAPAHIRDRARSMLALIASEQAQAGVEDGSRAEDQSTKADNTAEPGISGGGGPETESEAEQTDAAEAPPGETEPEEVGAAGSTAGEDEGGSGQPR